FIATVQPAVFYPPKVLLFALLPPGLAHWVFMLGHYVLAAWGFALFCREVGIRREAAFAGVAAFLFSTPVLMGNYHPTRIASLAWMPFIFLFTQRLLAGGGWGAFAALAAVLSLQLHAGYPEFTLDTSLFVPAHVLAYWVASWPKRPRWSAPLWIGAAFALAALVAAVLMLPLAEAGVEAKRAAIASGAMQREAAERSVSPALLLLHVFVPGISAFAWLSFGSRRAWPAAATIATCVFLIAGGGDLVRQLPGFSMIRFPFTAVLVAMFFPAWAAAAGADVFLRAGEGSARRKRVVIGIVIVGCLLAIVLYVSRGLALLDKSDSPFQTFSGSLLAVIGVGLILASAVLLARGAQPGGVFLAGALALVFSQLTAFPFKAHPAPFDRPGEHGEIRRLLGTRPAPEGRAFSLHDLLYGYNLTDRIRSVLGIEESFLPWRFRQIRERVRLIQVFGYMETPILATMPGFLNAMDLEYLAVKPQESSPFEALGLIPLARDEKAVLLYNPRRMGPAWVNYSVRRLPSEQAAFDHITSKAFDPHVEAVVSEPLNNSYPERAEHLASSARAVRRPSPTEMEIDVTLPRPGLLVVSEAAYPGWSASVNGKPATWVQANFVLRGIELPAGDHQVRFVYRSPALRQGLVLSSIGVALLALAFGIAYARRQRRE
ncbi:MAG TPA: YfhO family protein, partial [Polyangiaceae bacterium]|nr:YfhO family protein [Polyangiaceae bacterium]